MDSYEADAFLLGLNLVLVSKMLLFERVDSRRLAYLFNNIPFNCCHESFFWNTCGQPNFCVDSALVNMSVWVNPLDRLIADCTGIRLQITIVNFSHHTSQLYINSHVLAFKRHIKYILYYNNLSWHDVTWRDMTWHYKLLIQIIEITCALWELSIVFVNLHYFLCFIYIYLYFLYYLFTYKLKGQMLSGVWSSLTLLLICWRLQLTVIVTTPKYTVDQLENAWTNQYSATANLIVTTGVMRHTAVSILFVATDALQMNLVCAK